uniref:NADH-ubiquinone oxidoreductase chain 4 n=1 Tax=Donax trunculus TaxID=40130 RepID=A0A286NT43_9BIVA|nr:NADH dehydrogenase subunit 4 [Donax trunculus]ATA66398.1 NADH dehydrogenase subunit 4 [Donax trunculus]
MDLKYMKSSGFSGFKGLNLSSPMFMGLSILVLLEMYWIGRLNHMVEGMSMGSSWWAEDLIGVGLISLTIYITITSLVSSDDDFMADKEYSKFFMTVFLVGVMCVMVFSSSKIFFFYFFFESSLLPTMVLILGWGYQPERLQAGLQMVMYTVCGSLPLLVLISWMLMDSGSDCMLILSMLSSSSLGDYNILWLFLFLGMLVKIPVFSVHGWLPKAHVEAPLSGSMLLAGILLKLGIFGVCRVLMFAGCPSSSFSSAIMVVSLWGGVVCSLLCLCFFDLKSIIAYSSIAHMALSLGGLFSFNNTGWMGGICMALAHGLCSPCMFSLANYTYMCSGSRSTLLCKGVLKGLPGLSSLWFIFCALNLGCPPSANFFSECFLFCCIMGYSSVMVIPLFSMCFLAAGYSLFIYSSVNHGYQSALLRPHYGLSARFISGMVLSGVVLFAIFLNLDLFFL